MTFPDPGLGARLQEEVERQQREAFAQRERENFYGNVVKFMREDGRGLDAAIVRLRSETTKKMDAVGYSSRERSQVWDSFNGLEHWMHTSIEQARELARLADGKEPAP
jgi:pyoverdine/dityrosine biosynthesis protein Dit1